MRILTVSILALTLIACSNDDKRSDTGNACEVIDDCYPDLDPTTLSGPVVCLDRVEAGYCTHECDVDADCCSAEGECEDNGPPQVCAPFESTGMRMCFISCEGAADNYCSDAISPDFNCSSTGGGSENRKVCTPGG